MSPAEDRGVIDEHRGEVTASMLEAADAIGADGDASARVHKRVEGVQAVAGKYRVTLTCEPDSSGDTFGRRTSSCGRIDPKFHCEVIGYGTESNRMQHGIIHPIKT